VRDDDVLSMQRAVVGPGGSARLLHWLSRRVDGPAVLLDPGGVPAQSAPGVPGDVLAAAEREIRRVVAGEVAAASVSGPSWWARVVGAAGGTEGGPALLVTSGAPLPPDESPLIAHAAALLGLRWSADQRSGAVAQIREAVLHLLMGGEIGPARQVASVMKPDLPDMVRVVLVEGTAAVRNAIADRCETACGGQAWIVRCPVYDNHVIVISPVQDPADPGEQLLATLRATATGTVAIGVGDPVDLRDTAAGYEQACHALAVARHRPDRLARYTAADDLAAALGHQGQHWARQALAPLLDYKPARALDLNDTELRMTMQSWLTFRHGAARHLKIQPTALAKRLRRLEVILGRDLYSLADQAELHLALQLLHRPGPRVAGTPPQLAELLASGEARDWAKVMLAPLEESPVLLDTVRAYLAEGESSEAAAALISVSGHPVTGRQVRRRLARIEDLLGRSLSEGPSARYDVLLALRIRAAGQP
jgi:diguanylate cyclase with GGDEF domain/PucR-like helix-turn-helix protein